jgi:hypothetical protein
MTFCDAIARICSTHTLPRHLAHTSLLYSYSKYTLTTILFTIYVIAIHIYTATTSCSDIPPEFPFIIPIDRHIHYVIVVRAYPKAPPAPIV